ncbi:D-glycerate dehydrogenase [Halioglobus japonicus]|uniref:D-glycerate dehydrogenase n=1 Tax=Halioglobus japonicus TaxID=930805 RepID=A0AAP8SME8_9GAMM|nr:MULTISPECIES: D-glycerate dehydrogenase [Halioglobus]AQA17561.1 D-glycerate dehydrogenase [Halioglobus japonicus]KZX56156.1 D-glycerate dehydrogenase [Halioglobus sp. HI00S01]PLW85500.1 D-glycerate dehydrogenase [Halioglobus japonicus]GHD15971.1 D-glycerate dehydrogenase [Halioglobus japonicus]
MTKRVLVTHQLPGERFHDLCAHCDVNVWMGPGLLSAEALREELAGCHGLLCLLTDRITAELLAQMPDLEFVSSMSVGVDHVDTAALSARNIPLGHTPGVLVDTTADTAFALMMAASRRVVEADHFVRQGNWTPENAWAPDFFTGKDVSGATLGIVGMGAIGQAMARRAQGFGMRVLGWNRSPRDVAGIDSVDLDKLLAESDFVSIHVALADETRMLINADKIALMKPGSVLVNSARGGIVDEDALAQALLSGHLYAAGIDVFEREPVPTDNPLLTLPNVVVAPHIGSATVNTRARMADLAVENALAALAGERMPHCFNPQIYG